MNIPHLGSNWKSSVQGFLSFAVITLLTLQGYLAVMAPSPTLNKVLLGVNIAIGLAKAWIGLLQTDAGTVPAYVPGKGIENVPSHELPDSPTAVPVVKQP